MDYAFRASTFRDMLHRAAAPLLEKDSKPEDEHSAHNLLRGMEQAIDVMARVDADLEARGETAASGSLDEKEITEIGDYALELLEALVALAEEQTGEVSRDLMRLSIPVSLWVARHGGRLNLISLAVNSLASYANELMEPHALAELAGIIEEIIQACSDEIRQDLEQGNPLRPWRVLNLNYGIVATRSHDPALIERAYDQLVQNLPGDARDFFREGMAQMDAIGYPQEVREVVERYHRLWGAEQPLH